MNSLFEETRRRIETALVKDDRLSDESYQNRAMADMAAAIRMQAEALSRQMTSLGQNIVAGLPRDAPAHQAGRLCAGDTRPERPRSRERD